MKKILTILVIGALGLPAYTGTERLIGTWKSNKPVTVEYLKKHTNLNAPTLAKVSTALGKMAITFDEQTITFKLDDWSFVTKYKIINEFPSAIMIESENSATKKMEKTRLDIDATGFWTADNRIPGFKERFDKEVKPESKDVPKAADKEAPKAATKEVSKAPAKEVSKSGK